MTRRKVPRIQWHHDTTRDLLRMGWGPLVFSSWPRAGTVWYHHISATSLCAFSFDFLPFILLPSREAEASRDRRSGNHFTLVTSRVAESSGVSGSIMQPSVSPKYIAPQINPKSKKRWPCMSPYVSAGCHPSSSGSNLQVRQGSTP